MEEKLVEACQRCDGRCCKRIRFNMRIGKPVQELLEAHYGRSIEVLSVRVNHTCRHLDDDGKCGIYEDRPNLCREFVCGPSMNPSVLQVEIDGSQFER